MLERKISYSEVEKGMTISRDVLTESGMFLIPANTLITSNHILKMKLYQVGYLHIYEEEADEINSNDELSIVQTENYKAFSNQYVNQVDSIKDEFTKITTKGNVNTDDIYSLVFTVMNEVNNNSSLLSYLCRLKSKDDITYTHSLNVSILSNVFGKWLNMNDTDLINLSVAGMLHDIGKTQIDNNILKKPGKLTPDEFNIIKKHTTLGYKMIADSKLDYGIKQAVLMHHVKMNGYGYPLGIEWDNVHKYTKIISILDIYDAMTSDRPYHKRYHPFTVIRMFEEECYGVLDTEYLYIFLKNIAQNYIGNQVYLSTGEKAKIIFINNQSPSKPIVQTEDKKIIDLFQFDNITITKFI